MQAGVLLTLGEVASQHLGRVLRMQSGDSLLVFNGEGGEFPATIAEVSKKSVKVRLAERVERESESPLKVQLGQCLSKGERMDYAVQKATELGVSTITPLFSERSEVKLPAERAQKRQRHWQQVAISACEQSYRCLVPSINEPTSLMVWLDQQEAELKLVLDPRGAESLPTTTKPQSIALLVGPEGGLSEAEIEQAVKAGFKPVVFGPRVLRTETAPVAALSVLQYLWGDWR